MAPRSTWRGAVEVAGYAVNIAIYPRVKSSSGGAFKLLGADGKPAKQRYITGTDHEKLAKKADTKVAVFMRGDCQRGVEVGDSKFTPLTDEQAVALEEVDKSELLQPLEFVPAESLPFELADRSFVVVPDDKVPGAEANVTVVYNGLRHTGLAFTSQIVTRGGTKDAIFALYVAGDELRAVSFPFETQLNETPDYEWETNTKAGKVFGAYLEAQDYKIAESFDHSAYVSESAARQQKIVEAILGGKVPSKPIPSRKADASLMALLEEGAKATKPKKAPTKKRTAKKKAAA